MKIFKWIFIGSIALTGILGFVFPNPQPHFWWHYIPVFDAGFGLIGCILIIFVSKALGHYWVQKKEDYYD